MSLSNVKQIVLVLSGKGGVGKSSITTQLALSLSLAGKSVGILDIDLTGPSIPRLLGLEDAKITQAPGGWLPVQVHPSQILPQTSDIMEKPTNGSTYSQGNSHPAPSPNGATAPTPGSQSIGALYAISLGFLLPSRSSAVVWRGPKKTAMVRQFLTDVLWPSIDYLLIDTPPGTSDEHISLAETLLQQTATPSSTSSPKLAGAVIVTTPQAVAVSDVRKELSFCRKVGIGVLGVVENMSGYVCECCGEETNLFGRGGGEVMAQEFGMAFLGRVPVDGQWGVLVEEGRRPRYGSQVPNNSADEEDDELGEGTYEGSNQGNGGRQVLDEDHAREDHVNEDPEKLNRVLTRVLGEDSDRLLTDEVKWLAVTHKSFDHGRRGFNDRLAYLGKRIVELQASLHMIAASAAAPEPPAPDPWGRQSYDEPKGLAGLTLQRKTEILNKQRTAKLASKYGLSNVLRWKPKQPEKWKESGVDVVLTQALYAIVGAISLQNGGEVANRITRERILAPYLMQYFLQTVDPCITGINLAIVISSTVICHYDTLRKRPLGRPHYTMASAIFFLDLKGKTLLARNYRGDIPMSAVEKFPILLSEAEEESSAVPPCFSDEGINYLYIRHSNLYLLALTKRNPNPTSLLLFLHRLVAVFTEYFKTLEEESIRDNFVIIYELLDEMMDFGYPQTTESKILQEYITQESHKLEVQARPPIAVTNAVSWRSEGIRYRKNEVFLDVIESLNLLVSSTGNVLRSEILGAVKLKCYLSGMPELRLGLNDKVMFETTGRATRGKAVEMEDVKFHQCVRLSRFENDRTISFIPPDGEFELMSYRLNTQVKPLIWVESDVRSHSGSRIEYTLKARAQFKRRSTANNVEILVPVPEDADSPRFRTNIGSVHYAPEKSAIVWKIKQFGGGKEFLMRAELGLPS
ncbi:MAG: hypothetical protein Q9216_006716, partial [Gyalolechia sp. 2 TL-2023]